MNVRRRIDALRHMGRKRDGSRERCLWVIPPTTLPVATPGAAIRQAVPFRLQACVRVRGCPAFIGSGLCVRDSAWIRRFPSTDSTTARSGGLTYSPSISCVFLPQPGSRDTLDVPGPVGASPCRLRIQSVPLEDVVYRGANHPRSLRQGRQRPVGEMPRRRGHRDPGQGFCPLPGYRRPARRTRGVGRKPVDPLGRKTLPPPLDGRYRLAGPASRFRRAEARAGMGMMSARHACLRRDCGFFMMPSRRLRSSPVSVTGVPLLLSICFLPPCQIHPKVMESTVSHFPKKQKPMIWMYH